MNFLYAHYMHINFHIKSYGENVAFVDSNFIEYPKNFPNDLILTNFPPPPKKKRGYQLDAYVIFLMYVFQLF